MVTTALETVGLHKPVILKAEDTDSLVMCQDESQTSGLFMERGVRVYNFEQFHARVEPPLVRQNLLSCILLLRHHIGDRRYNALTMQRDNLEKEFEIFRDTTQP